MLNIPVGAYGRTRAGEKVGPIERRACNTAVDKAGFYYVTPQQPQGYYTHGRLDETGNESPRDLVAIWQDGPVVTETVTKTRIVPGVYDRIRVFDGGYGNEAIGVELFNRLGTSSRNLVFTADELDAAAAVLSALAKGLRDA